MRAANRTGEEYESEQEVDPQEAKRNLTRTGKEAKKLLRKLEKTQFDSDDEDALNPYISDVTSQSLVLFISCYRMIDARNFHIG